MPHTPAADAVIKKTDGTLTHPAMGQPQVQNYLIKLVNANSHASFKQALNDVFNGKGKSTGNYQQDNLPVFHASSGDGQQSVTLFYLMAGTLATIFAMGEHVAGNSYKVTYYGQPTGSFVTGAKITL